MYWDVVLSFQVSWMKSRTRSGSMVRIGNGMGWGNPPGSRVRVVTGYGYGSHLHRPATRIKFSYTRYLLIAVRCVERRCAHRARIRTFRTIRGIWVRYHVCAPRKPPIRLDPDALRAWIWINRQHTMTRALTLTHGLPSPFPLQRSCQKAPHRTRHSTQHGKRALGKTKHLFLPLAFVCATPRAVQYARY